MSDAIGENHAKRKLAAGGLVLWGSTRCARQTSR